MTALGHQEWKDAFADDNIPSNLMNRAFHILLTDNSNVKQNQTVIEINQPVAVKLYVKGYRNTADRRDQAMVYQEAAIKKALEDDRRCQTYAGIKNVIYQGGGLTELSADDDNVIRVTMNFNCIVMMANA